MYSYWAASYSELALRARGVWYVLKIGIICTAVLAISY